MIYDGEDIARDAELMWWYEHAAATLLYYAVDGTNGRNETDEIYQEIVEHRDGPTPTARAKYSSCGDLAMWLYARLGCLAAPWMNRDEEPGEGGELDWRSGVNLNRWVGKPIGPNPYAYAPKGREDLSAAYFGPGDVVVVNNVFGGHVLCVTAYEPPTAGGKVLHPPTLYTAEYGQPGGKAKVHTVSAQPGRLMLGKNPIIAHARLREVLRGEAMAGRLAPPDIDCLEGFQEPSAINALRKGLRCADVA